MTPSADKRAAPIAIKKYANRRLYNTATSSYVTLDHLAQMVKEGVEFVVQDAKTGEDITRSVLTQIIVEEESKGQHLLPVSFLRQLIGFYGDSLQSLVPRYLEHSMQAFTHNQEQMRRSIQDAMGGLFPFASFEEMSKQNMAFFENAMRMFSPLLGEAAKGEAKPEPGGEGAQKTAANGSGQGSGAEKELSELRGEMARMQKKLEDLSRKSG